MRALRRVLEEGRLAAPTVNELARGLGPREADLLRELVLGVLRWKSALDSEIVGTSRIPLPKLAPNLREILEVALHQLRHLDRIPPYAAVSEAVAHARDSGGEGASRLVNGVLRGILLLPPPEPPKAADAKALSTFYSHPLFVVERWLARFGAEATRRVLEADNKPPRLDLLVGPRGGSREEERAALAREGVETEPSPLVPRALTVLSGSGGGSVVRSDLLERGAYAIQDVGSQILPLLLPPGERLVDLAAAPGGKTLSALAHGWMRGSVALDASAARLRRVVENARRLALGGILTAAADASRPPLPARRFDRVILDAPCSGTGTLRKNPEIRYRVTREAIERISRSQEEWLAAAAELLARGGFLLYATCSLEEEENERVVVRVLERDGSLERAAIEPPTEAAAAHVEGDRFRILPDERSDGFTAHLIRRRA